MTNAPAISVVIPLYNAEKYLAECLDSILVQTMQDFEVVIVNDCTPDLSRQIAESYLEKFGGRLAIYDNEQNLGISDTRNNGLRRARGEYIFFMDDDDIISENALERLYRIAKRFNVDVVNSTEAYAMSEDGKEKVRKFYTGEMRGKRLLDTDIAWRIENFLLTDKFGWAPWRKLVRRDFLIKNEIFFPSKLRRVEDVMWSHALLFFAKKIIHIPLPVYFHRRPLASESKTMNRLQRINFRAGTLIHAIKWINEIMDRAPFFKKNPQYRYLILKHTVERFFMVIFGIAKKIPQEKMYYSMRRELKEDFGDYDVLLPILFTLMNKYHEIIADNISVDDSRELRNYLNSTTKELLYKN